MPYIAIKGFPKDEDTMHEVAERINAVLLSLWGCQQEHINISYEAVPPEDWDLRIEQGEIPANASHMLIRAGQRQYAVDEQEVRSDLPHYDRLKRCWTVDFPDRDSEEGDLLYVASEFARTGLIFPYNTSRSQGSEYHEHSHGFEGVIRALLDDPNGFTIRGFEEYYSKQEREMLSEIQNKLLEAI